MAIEYYRVRRITDKELVTVQDLSFSQVCQVLKCLSREEAESFWAKKEVHMQDGSKVLFVKEV